jgi:hypothetical protein
MNLLINAALFKGLLSVNTQVIIAEILIAAMWPLKAQSFQDYNAFIKSDLYCRLCGNLFQCLPIASDLGHRPCEFGRKMWRRISYGFADCEGPMC